MNSHYIILAISLISPLIYYLITVVLVILWGIFYFISTGYLFLIANFKKIWTIPLIILFSPILLIMALPFILVILSLFSDGGGLDSNILSLYDLGKLNQVSERVFSIKMLKKIFSLQVLSICFVSTFLALNLLMLIFNFNLNFKAVSPD